MKLNLKEFFCEIKSERIELFPIDPLPCFHFFGRKTNSRYMLECDLLQECKEIPILAAHILNSLSLPKNKWILTDVQTDI